MVFNSPIVGMSATNNPIYLQTETQWGAQYRDHVVVLTTFGGEVFMAEGQTGCLATTIDGPRLTPPSTVGSESVSFADSGPTSTPSMYADPFYGIQVTTNRCGGILRTEDWTAQYDQLEGNWLVKGSLSGEQQNRALPNKRYVTDKGELSFTIANGTLAPTDGDTFYFSTDSNILRVTELINNQGNREALKLPGKPVTFDYLAGPTDGGWDINRTRTFALVPITNANIVLRLRLESWEVEVVWN